MTESAGTTDELIVKANAGEPTAWDELVERFTPLLWNVVRAFRLSEADASDVIQATWLRLVEHLPTIRRPEALPGWLATTARREALRILRTQHTELSTRDDRDPDQEPPDTEHDPEILAVHRERNALLWRAMQQLPLHCQTLLRILASSDNRPYREIAATLDMPVGSIGPTRARCVQKLRQLLSVLAQDESAGENDLGDVLATENNLVQALQQNRQIMDTVPPEVVEDAVRIRDTRS